MGKSAFLTNRDSPDYSKSGVFMKIGFAGSRREMTRPQKDTFLRMMKKFRHQYIDVDFHMGNSTPSDRDAYQMILEKGLATKITFFPHNDRGEPAFELDNPLDLARRELKVSFEDKPTVFERNRSIINGCEVLIAAPKENREQKAIRYCKLVLRRLYIIYPDGTATKWPTK
jgi:hypothetical protein